MVRQFKYSKDEHARRGREAYERIRPQVELTHHGLILAIDIDTGEFELGDRMIEAGERLLQRLPEAQIWFERVGYPAVRRFGYHVARGRQ